MKNERRGILGALALSAATIICLPLNAKADSAEAPAMDVFKAIKTRRSVRAYADRDITDADLKAILDAAMLAPSAANEQPWEFVAIRGKDTLGKIGEINQYASYAKKAPVAILVCLNENKEKIKGMGIIDVSMSAQNLMLAARGLGIGSVFTGIYPEKDRIEKFRKLCGLPDSVTPIGLIVLGYPAIPGEHTVDRFNKAAIHEEKWGGSAK